MYLKKKILLKSIWSFFLDQWVTGLLQITDPISQIPNLTSTWIKEEWSTFINGINLFQQIGKKKVGYLCQTDLCLGAWVAQSLRVCLQLRSWSQGPGIKPHIGLPAQRGVCLSLCRSCSLCSCVLSLNKKTKSFFKKRNMLKDNKQYKNK